MDFELISEKDGVQSCMQDGRPLLPVDYKELEDAAESLDKINIILPQIEDLANCGFITSAFREIYANDCDDLQSSTKSMTVGAMIAAVSLTLASLMFCVCIRCDVTIWMVYTTYQIVGTAAWCVGRLQAANVAVSNVALNQVSQVVDFLQEHPEATCE